MSRIDVHAHPIPDFYRDALIAAGRGPSIAGGFPAWTPSLAQEQMDEHDISAALLSVSQPGVNFGDDAAARKLARSFNEFLAKLSSKAFGGFAVLPLPDIEGACAEIDFALGQLGLDGVGIFASYGDMFLGDERLEPVFERLDHHKAAVFVHPNLNPSVAGLKLDIPAWVLEYPIDTSRAVANMVLSGRKRRYPNIRWILAHAGGTIPYLSWRIAAAPIIDKRYAELDADAIRGDLADFWYETAQAPGPETFGALELVSRPDRILFGSDFPYCSTRVTSAMIAALAKVASLTPERRRGVESGNAQALFPRFR